MDLLRLLWHRARPGSEESDEPLPESVEGTTPGIAALLEGVTEGENHSVLDLGPGVGSHFRVYSRFARQMSFADLLAAAGQPGWDAALDELPIQPDHPYELIFAWDIMDRLPPEARSGLVERLVEVSAPGARLHVMVRASDQAPTHPLRFVLMDASRLRYEPTGRALPSVSPIQSAELERLLHPFRVIQAFTLRVGFREYVAVRS